MKVDTKTMTGEHHLFNDDDTPVAPGGVPPIDNFQATHRQLLLQCANGYNVSPYAEQLGTDALTVPKIESGNHMKREREEAHTYVNCYECVFVLWRR